MTQKVVLPLCVSVLLGMLMWELYFKVEKICDVQIADGMPILLPTSPTLEQVQRHCKSKCPESTVFTRSPDLLNNIMCNINNSVPLTASCENIHTYNFNKTNGKMNYFLAKHLPCEDAPAKKHWGRCAVVGNSGSLVRLPHGPEIDDHDTIIRFNEAPVERYQQYIGSTTHIRLFNQQFVTGEDGKPSVPEQLQVEDSLKLVRYRGSASISKYGPELTEHFFATSALLYDEFLLETAWCLVHMEEYLRNNTNILDNIEPGFKSATSGWYGIVLASSLCEEIDLYGFVSIPTDWNHYYGRHQEYGSLQGISHNFALEKAVLKYWSEKTDKFRIIP